MRTLKIPLLCIFCLAAVGCGSLREERVTYNLDGTVREIVSVKAKSVFSQTGLRGLHYEVKGNSNDLSRALSVDHFEKDVSDNAADVVKAAGSAVGEAVGAAVTP